MRPRRDDDALVDVLDVILRDGVVLKADIIISVAEVPLVGVQLTALVAGMETMTEYGLFESWDDDRRSRAIAGSPKAEAESDDSPHSQTETTPLSQTEIPDTLTIDLEDPSES